MAVELATGYVSLVPETSNFAREAGRAWDRVASDMQRRFARAFDDSAEDMRRTFTQASGQAFDGAAADMRQRLARGVDGVASDMHREFARASTQAFSGAADGMQQQFRRGFDASASDMHRAFSRASDRVGRDLEQAIGDAGQGAGQQGGEAAAGGIADSLQGKAGVIGQALSAVFAVAGVSAGGLFVKALQRGLEHEQAIDIAQARLGLDDDTMHKIGFASGQAYAGAFGESVEGNIDAARRAIQSGLLDPDATAQDTQRVIEQLTGISDLMGEEIPAVARAAGQAIRTGLAKDATEAFDLFATAERNGLNVSEDFLDTIIEYGTQFRKLGVTGPEAIGLINQAVKSGARDTDIAADAMKEFSIRVVDGSESTADAFEKLGVPVEKTMGMFLNGGGEARDAMTSLFDALRKVEDPVKANEIALALFGTQLEDLGDAFHNFNLDSAANSLGKVGGAASDALNAMGGNAATSIEGAKRSIEVSADAIGSALAKAFGPELAKVADWVTKHQPEILGFMGKLADGAFAAADAFLGFSSLSLNAFADLAEGVGPILEQMLDPIGKVAEVIGKLTGSEGLQDLGHTLQEMENTMRGAADGARDIADGIDNSARPSLDRMRANVAENIAETQHAAEVTRALGGAVTALPDGHDIIIKENTPEVQARLEALGYRVTHMENGQFRVEANTAEAQQRLNDFIHQNSGRVLPLKGYVSFNQSIPVETLSKVHDIPPGLATGGVFRGKGGPTDDANLIRISDREHLAYITRAQAVSPATLPLLEAINSGWAPPAELLHAMVPGFATGGVAGSRASSWAQAQNGKPYIYGPQDCSWYMSGIYNQLTGKNVRFTTASDFTAFGFKPGSDPNGFTIGTDGGLGQNGHMAGRLLGTAVESDGTNGVQFGGKADGPEKMPKQFYLPRDLWNPPETDNPALQSGTGATPGSGPGSALGGSPGTSGVGSGGSGGGAPGGTFGGAQVPAGVTPVWIIGSNITGTSTSSSSASSDTTTQASPSESFAPQASAPTQSTQMPDIGARALQAGGDFLNANLDQFLGDIGLRREGGAIQALAKVIFDAMARATSEAVAQATRNSGSLTRYAGRPF